MPHFKVAHMRKQGQDMIVVPLDSNFGHKPSSEQASAISAIQMRARSAGLAGKVVPVWDNGNGRMAFIAPQPWHPFFCSINLRFVAANLNRELSW